MTYTYYNVANESEKKTVIYPIQADKPETFEEDGKTWKRDWSESRIQGKVSGKYGHWVK